MGDQRLHYVEAGEGPLIVLLHGFPEFWFGWRLQIEPLVAAGFRVVVPDTRGYNLSWKPEGFEAYAVELLAADIRGLIEERGAKSALLVGHDWGGSIAWITAMNHPEVVERLAILNAAHPRRLQEGLRNPNQLRKSWYFFFFAVPGLPEDVVHARDWHFFRHFLHDANPPYTPQELERYVEAWSQPGAAAGMINYYRASVRQSQKEAAAKLRPVSAPTLVIWGERDSYLGPELAEPDRDDVPNLDRVERLPDASHWVHHDAAERVDRTAHRLLRPRPSNPIEPNVDDIATREVGPPDSRHCRFDRWLSREPRRRSRGYRALTTSRCTRFTAEGPAVGDRLRIWKKIPHGPPAERSIRRNPVATTRPNVGSGHDKAGRGYQSLTTPKIDATASRTAPCAATPEG